MTDCLFCKIVSKEVDSEVVHETEQTLAFRDINAAAPTHVLFVPKRHIESAEDLGAGDAKLLGELFDAMARVARGEGLERGFRIVTNVGPEGNQAIPHLHFHLMGGRAMSWPPG